MSLTDLDFTESASPRPMTIPSCVYPTAKLQFTRCQQDVAMYKHNRDQNAAGIAD